MVLTEISVVQVRAQNWYFGIFQGSYALPID